MQRLLDPDRDLRGRRPLTRGGTASNGQTYSVAVPDSWSPMSPMLSASALASIS